MSNLPISGVAPPRRGPPAASRRARSGPGPRTSGLLPRPSNLPPAPPKRQARSLLNPPLTRCAAARRPASALPRLPRRHREPAAAGVEGDRVPDSSPGRLPGGRLPGQVRRQAGRSRGPPGPRGAPAGGCGPRRGRAGREGAPFAITRGLPPRSRAAAPSAPVAGAGASRLLTPRPRYADPSRFWVILIFSIICESRARAPWGRACRPSDKAAVSIPRCREGCRGWHAAAAAAAAVAAAAVTAAAAGPSRPRTRPAAQPATALPPSIAARHRPALAASSLVSCVTPLNLHPRPNLNLTPTLPQPNPYLTPNPRPYRHGRSHRGQPHPQHAAQLPSAARQRRLRPHPRHVLGIPVSARKRSGAAAPGRRAAPDGPAEGRDRSRPGPRGWGRASRAQQSALRCVG